MTNLYGDCTVEDAALGLLDSLLELFPELGSDDGMAMVQTRPVRDSWLRTYRKVAKGLHERAESERVARVEGS